MAQGIMTPFCLIINSHGHLVPHIPADAARQSGCAGWRAKGGQQGKTDFSFFGSPMLSPYLPVFGSFLPAVHCPKRTLNSVLL